MPSRVMEGNTGTFSITDFASGSILKIYLHNFLTYDDLVFEAGPYLNLIIGPNATGKSTLVNAICLGLGGRTSVLGRAKDILEFIKHGRDEATIEIVLRNKNPGTANHVIKRVISTRGAPSSWFIQNRSSTQKQVEELVNSLGIQVSNLCQFLPQDRVGDFVKMSNTELLVNTLKAADKKLYDNHKRLRTAWKETTHLENDYKKVKENLDREVQLNEGLERDIRNIEERRTLENQIKQLHMKRPWMEYECVRIRHEAHKQERVTVEKDLESAKKILEPEQKKLDKMKREEVDKLASIKDLNVKVNGKQRSIQSLTDELDSLKEQHAEVDQDLHRKEDEARNWNKMVNTVKSEIQALELLQTQTNSGELNSHVEQMTGVIDGHRRNVKEKELEIAEFQEEKNTKTIELRAQEQKLQELNNKDMQKLEMIRRKDKNLYHAIVWYRKNKEKFQGESFEPPMITLKMKDARNAKYIENSVSIKDMKMFLFSKKEDYDFFFNTVRNEMNIPVNAATAPSQTLNEYKRTQNYPDINTIRSYGFDSYLLDMVDAPDPILVFLCQQASLHKVPKGNASVNSKMDDINNKLGIKRYLSDITMFSSKTSHFSHHVITRTSDLKPATMLIHSTDEERVRALGDEVRLMRRDVDECAINISRLDKERGEVTSLMSELVKERQDVKEKIYNIQRAKDKLQTANDKLKRLLDNKKDIKKEKEQATEKHKEIHGQEFEITKQKIDKQKDLMKNMMTRSLFCLQLMTYTNGTLKQTQVLDNASSSLNGYRARVEELKNLERDTKNEAKKLRDEAVKAIGGELKPNREMATMFNTLPQTIAEIDGALADIQSRIELINVDYDDGVEKEFQNRKKKIGQLQAEEAEKAKRRDVHQWDTDELRANWLPHVEELIQKISGKFSEFFKVLQCAGEIQLKMPPNPNDYDNYGIAIHVKYGDNKPMKELTTFQSGGERSVATVLYMLSLQDLSNAPFRCVDEINQGMDADNERKVFELMVKSASGEGTPQCFLLTPKLLPGLPYDERIKINVIHNGPYNNVDHKDWNIAKFVEIQSSLED